MIFSRSMTVVSVFLFSSLAQAVDMLEIKNLETQIFEYATTESRDLETIEASKERILDRLYAFSDELRQEFKSFESFENTPLRFMGKVEEFQRVLDLAGHASATKIRKYWFDYSVPLLDATTYNSLFVSLIDWREAYKSGICAVYNPSTGELEWREEYKSGVAGVYNPLTQTVEWKVAYKSGIAGVFNPKTGEIEWQEAYKSGIFGVYNPITEEVEWMESRKSGVYGVFNPVTQDVEFRETKKAGVSGVFNPDKRSVEWYEADKKSNVSGVFNPVTREVEWRQAYKSGVYGVLKNSENNPTSCIGLYADDDYLDDDDDGAGISMTTF